MDSRGKRQSTRKATKPPTKVKTATKKKVSNRAPLPVPVLPSLDKTSPDEEIDRGNSGKAEDRKLTETKRIPIYRQPVSVPDGEQLEIDHFDLPDDSVSSIFVIMSSI